MKVRDVMTRDVRVIGPDTPIREAAQIMRDVDSGFLPVCDGDRLQGTITDRDIVIRVTAEGLDPERTRVREAMSPGVFCCYEDDDAADATATMAERQVRRLPVLSRDKRLVGVCSIGDLAITTGDERAVGAALEDISEPTAPSVTRAA